MFNFIMKMFSEDIGIDLGTSTTLIYSRNRGLVLNEPSVVAISKDTGEVISVGLEAKRMIGKTPANIVALRPLRNGVIANFEATEKMIRYFIRKAVSKSRLFYPRIVIGAPSGITEVERRAVIDSAKQAGAREVYVIEEAMAAAIGADLPIEEPAGNMVVDIGGGTTEVAVISLGGMVVSKTIRVAGDEMDLAIMQYFRKRYNLIIGETTAEETKISIGSAFPLKQEQTKEVKGRDQVSGLPRTVVVSSEEIRQALNEPIRAIVEAIKETLEETPAEFAADLVERGIVMTGGGSLLRGFPDLISQETSLPVHLAQEPLLSVAIGTGKYLEMLDRMKK